MAIPCPHTTPVYCIAKNTPLACPWPTVKPWAHTDDNRARSVPRTWPNTNQ
jgi:hypothetical protein